MKTKVCVQILLFVVLCLGVAAVAQDSPLATDITGAGTKGTIPVFTGKHAIGNSIVKQVAGAIDVAGAVNATGEVDATSLSVTDATNATSGVYSDNTVGINGTGNAIYGQDSSTGQSNTGAGLSGLYSVGVWGDGGSDGNYALFATADDRSSVIAENNGADFYTDFNFNNATGGVGYPWAAENGDGAGCYIDPTGDINCTGSKNAVVPVDGGAHHVALSAIESPKNWFEDFGSEQLVGGVATVRLDAKFMQTVNSKQEYHVFLTPNGDCKGLYISQKTPTSFEVRELGGGNSSVKFDYRITALRKNFESIRFADHTREFPLGRKDGKVVAAQK
jgi:hypothetical protein